MLQTIFSVFSQQTEFPILTGLYLGQNPPGTTPEMFAPGIISSEEFHDFKGSFSADGKEYYFCRHSLPDIIPTLFYTKIVNGTWIEPAPLQIAKGTRTFHPCVSHDNHWLLFYWQFQKEQSHQSGYYASARTDTGWSVPKYAGQGTCATIDNSGQLYTQEIVKKSPPEFYMNMVAFRNGLFEKSERLHIDTHYGKQTHPCIARDGSYIIFDIQDENSNLFICFRNKDGNWGDVVDLTKHGLPPNARNAYISPDGKYLFFGYNGDIWWVSTQIIEALK